MRTVAEVWGTGNVRAEDDGEGCVGILKGAMIDYWEEKCVTEEC